MKGAMRLREGDKLDGYVKNIRNYGVFVDLGFTDGFLHKSDIKWGIVDNPEDEFCIGDPIEVKVDKVKSNGDVDLVRKELLDNPWKEIKNRYPEGINVLGYVKTIVDYGAFVEIEKGVEGLIHVSNLEWARRIKDVREKFHEGDIVEVSVIDVDCSNQEIELSLKHVDPNPYEVLKDEMISKQIRGEIRTAKEYGLFVGIQKHIDGLLHISDIDSVSNYKELRNEYEEGELIDVVIADVDVDSQEISLEIA